MMDTIASPDCESTSLSPEVQESAVLRIAMARAECMRLGITPTEFAELLLPEVLLALMVDGMRQEEVNGVFQRFTSEEVPRFFLQVKRVSGFCDCHREATEEHDEACRELMRSSPIRRSLFGGDDRFGTYRQG